MAEIEKETEQSYDDSDDRFELLWVAVPICALIISTAAFYFGKPVLLPLAIALIMSVVFSPVATRLEPYCGRFVSAALVVLLVIGFIGAMGYFLTIELTAVADQVSEYSDNIGNKIAALEKNTPPWLQHVKEAVTDVQNRVASANPAPRKPREVMALPVPSPLSDSLKPVAPIVDAVVNTLLIIVLLFFLLYSRKDLRDRFVRLAARGRVPIAAEALETASYTVGRYLFLFSLINLAYGLATGIVAWYLGLPSAALWGLVAFLLRFIPYVGAISSAILPTLVAFAMFPGWSKAIEILDCLHTSRPGGGADRRAVYHRPWNRRFAGRAAGIRDVLVVAVGNTGTAAFDAADCVPEGRGRLYSAARISLDPARRGSCAR